MVRRNLSVVPVDNNAVRLDQVAEYGPRAIGMLMSGGW